jgi:hypothetical protein
MAPKVSKAQVGKAVDALIQYVGKQNEESTSLIEDEDFLYLVREDRAHTMPGGPLPRRPPRSSNRSSTRFPDLLA